MKISVNRLCKLAGVENSGKSRGRLSEGSNRSYHEEPYYQDEVEFRYGRNQLAEDIGGEGALADGHCMSEEDLAEMDDDDLMAGMPGLSETDGMDEDEVLEIDERELVQELRRAKRLMREARRARQKQLARKSSIDTMIEQEVSKMMEDYNQTASWVYGGNKPTRSKKGYVTRSFPGIGFGKKF